MNVLEIFAEFFFLIIWFVALLFLSAMIFIFVIPCFRQLILFYKLYKNALKLEKSENQLVQSIGRELKRDAWNGVTDIFKFKVQENEYRDRD